MNTNPLSPPATHCNSGSSGASVEPFPGNNRPPLFVFGQNKVHYNNNCNERSTTVQASASSNSNSNTNNVSNNNSIRDNNAYEFTTPSKNNNNPTDSSFNVYEKNGATSLEAVGAPWDQGGSGYISRLIALSNNRTNGNISSNCITIISKKRKDRSSTDSSVSLYNSIQNNNIQQDGAPQLQQPEEADDLRIGNIANLHKIIKLLPSQHSKTETMGLMCLHSIINNQIGKLIFNDDNNMWLVMDDEYLLTANDDLRYTFNEATSEVYGTGVKDFLEEVYAHVIINEKLLVELLGGNKEAYLILNHILDAKQYRCKVKEEYALVYWLETDIARDLLYVTLDEDDIEPYTSATPEMIDETSQRLISDISSSQPTFYSRIKSVFGRKRQSVDDDVDLDRPAKKQKTKLVEAVTVLTDLVTRPAKKFRGAVLAPLTKSLLNDETRMNKLLSEEEEMNDVLAHQLMVQEGKNEALGGQLEARVQEVEHQKRKSAGAQYKAALEHQRLTNELTTAKGEADSARRHTKQVKTDSTAELERLQLEFRGAVRDAQQAVAEANRFKTDASQVKADAQREAKSYQDRITELETQKAQVEAEAAAARQVVSIVYYLSLTVYE